MKKIIIYVILLLLIVGFVSCKAKIGDDGHFDTLITELIKPAEVELLAIKYSRKSETIPNQLALKVKRYRTIKKGDPKLMEFKEAIGDVYSRFAFSCDPRSHYRPALMYSIKDIQIISLTDYSSKYPNNSVLNDIVEVSYSTFLSALMLEKGPYFDDYSKIQREVLSKLSFPLDLIRVSKDWFLDTYDSVLNFKFLEIPDEPNQKLKVTITFTNGLTLSTENEVVIKKEN